MQISKHSPFCPRKRAFTLIELMLTVVVSALVMSSLTMVFSSFATTYTQDKTDGDIELVPAYGEVTTALNLIVSLKEDLNDAAAVFILGGASESSNGSTFDDIDSNFEATPAALNNFAAQHPADINSPLEFRNYLKTAYPNNFADGDPTDFTAFLISNQNGNALLGILKSRRTLTDDGINAIYTVSYIENGAVSFSYQFAVPITQENNFPASMKPGVTHYWLRQDTNWGINEHFGYKIVLPDPTAMAYSLSNNNTFSRFVFYIPTKK